MIQVGDKIISTELFENHFFCHLEKCRGMCCVYGDAGAPLEEKETAILEKNVEKIKPFLRKEGVKAIEEKGSWEIDDDGDRVTPLMGEDDCAYSIIDNGIARCGIEVAFHSEAISFQKPVSCHLYPIRVSRIGQNLALNYHRWDVCSPARKRGAEFGIPVFRFLKEPLVRVFGQAFYEELEKIYEEWKRHGNFP